ncbi:hypothetical protein F3Y22_tig00110788pilonHSYRG00588 [Hibiscus syriacus]|uniref:Uncharacterized protein n=1 Tax=Hibiscus syriacus TaxID=106335 RepID=A0A6A2ZQ84_HIBSY|nr:hypothetical protein F3Y22_tig00110788pilonHSYRG00588 [Hibiscus syriacus]
MMVNTGIRIEFIGSRAEQTRKEREPVFLLERRRGCIKTGGGRGEAHLRSSVESLVVDPRCTVTIRFPPTNVRRNRPRENQRRWLMLPTVFSYGSTLEFSLGGDEVEETLPETGGADADAAT